LVLVIGKDQKEHKYQQMIGLLEWLKLR
jgi:hypothetical protein